MARSYAALCKRDATRPSGSRRSLAPSGGAARSGRKGKGAASDSEGSEGELEEDSEGEAEEGPKRSSSFSSDHSREPTPLRYGRGKAVAAPHGLEAKGLEASTRSPALRGSPGSPRSAGLAAASAHGLSARPGSHLGPRRRGGPAGEAEAEAAQELGPAAKRRALGGGEAEAGGASSSARQLRPHAHADAPGRVAPLAAPPPPPPPSRLYAVGRHREPTALARPRPVDSGGSGPAPKKLPLTISIPNAASADPPAGPPTVMPSVGMPPFGIEIRVMKVRPRAKGRVAASAVCSAHTL